VLVRLLRFYAHPPKIFGGEGFRKSHEGASSLLQERRRFQTKGFARSHQDSKQKCAAFFAAPSSDCRCFQHFKNALCGKIHNKFTRVSLPRRPTFSAPSSYQDSTMRYIDQAITTGVASLIELNVNDFDHDFLRASLP